MLGPKFSSIAPAHHRTERSGSTTSLRTTCRTSQAYCGLPRHPASPTRCLRRWSAAFQASYPNVRRTGFITDRIVDQIAEGVDLVFKIGEQLKDSSLVARRILTYRHQLVASPVYLAKCKAPKIPQDLLDHRLLAFSFWTPENSWNFAQANGKKKETLTFPPFLSMNDYAGLATALLAGTGIGDLPPWCSLNCCATAGSSRSCRDGTSHLPSLGGPSWKSLHHAARACVQGIRDANGADALPNASDLRVDIGVFRLFERKSI